MLSHDNESKKLHSPQVICLGEALVDRLGPLGGDPLNDQPVEDRLGGAPANVACGLAKLGTLAAFFGRLGNDSIGQSFQNLFNARGINIDGLQIDQIRPSRVVLVRRDFSGERSFQGFVGDKGEGFADQSFDIDDLIDVWPNVINKARYLLIGTIPLATRMSEDALLWCVEKALESDIKIILDINWRPTFWDEKNIPNAGPTQKEYEKIMLLLEKASFLKLAKEEAQWFFNCEDPNQISQALPKKPDVVVTDGALPVQWLVGGFCGQTETISPQVVVDTTGAGDAFTAGLINQLLRFSFKPVQYQEAEYAVRFAAACGALVCTGRGAIDPQPSYEDALAFLSETLGGKK